MKRVIMNFNYNALLALFFMMTTSAIHAQDKITLTNGTEIKAKVLEVGEAEIKYKAFEYLDGPTRIVPVSEVFMIKYENGNRDVFNKVQSTAPTNLNPYTPGGAPLDTGYVTPKKTKFGGPRVGYTYITPGIFARELADLGKNPYITQFGWQFEVRMFSLDKGPSGILEFVPFIGGMEQGLFLPSASLLIGLRGSGTQAMEFALGPNVSVGGLGMVFAMGTNFRTENINFPVNIAYVPSQNKKEIDNVTQQSVISPTGSRITLTIGFNMRKK